MIKMVVLLKYGSVLSIFLLATFCLSAQSSASSYTFLEIQRSIPKVSDIMKRKEDTLMRQFRQKGLEWPAKYIYLRSFKYDSELEIWVKNRREDKYKLFKTYKVCALAGTLGPKRMAGDYQVPEGFYYINEFNPRSQYHFALGLNYPNASDKLLGDLSQPGGEIYIHGSCVTTGCIPITDEQIEEVYILAAHAKDLGEDFIPVHIFPVNFKNQQSLSYLNKYLENFSENNQFERSLRNAYNYFEKNHELPPIIVDEHGTYLMEEVSMPVVSEAAKPEVKRKRVHPPQPIKDEDLAKSVDFLPEYPGGNIGFKGFIDQLGKNLYSELDPGQKKTFVMVEYIIDDQGRPVYARVLHGGNENMNEKIEDAFLKMPQWKPAKRLGVNIGIKLKQTIMVGVD